MYRKMSYVLLNEGEKYSGIISLGNTIKFLGSS